ncbi:MAG: antitoxin YefM [Lysobacterales bacterium]|jgi:antitoxin YefM
MCTQYGTLITGGKKMIKSISVRELRPNIAKVMQDIHAKFDRYIVSRHGHPEVVMLSVDDYESLLETIDIQSDKALMKRIKKAESEITQNKGKSLEQLHKELGIV